LGVTDQTIFRYEAGKAEPTITTLRRLALISMIHKPELCRVFLAPISRELETPIEDLQPVLCPQAA
jgi:transcriptional regulator with XRE-family HTH domain